MSTDVFGIGTTVALSHMRRRATWSSGKRSSQEMSNATRKLRPSSARPAGTRWLYGSARREIQQHSRDELSALFRNEPLEGLRLRYCLARSRKVFSLHRIPAFRLFRPFGYHLAVS